METSTLVILLVGCVGILLGYLIAFVLQSRETSRLRIENARLSQQYEQTVEGMNQSFQEKDKLCEERIAAVRDEASRQLSDMKERLSQERTHFDELRLQSDRQWNEKFETMRQQLAKQSAQQLIDRQKELQETNRSQFDALMQPIREQFAAFRKSIDDSRTQSEVNKHSIEKTFLDTMKLFQQQQDAAVRNLTEQTERIGSDAANLTRALKGESKTQGDWGEMILLRILEDSGLRRGEEFLVQENVKDAGGSNFRPDVIVRFPEGTSVVIDSKVSLTAYAEAVAASDPQQREHLLDEHVRSIRRHIDELAAKNYADLVKGSVGYVLMFVPNESSYIAAMKRQPSLSFDAYKKHVIILSPTNLMMTLHLTYNLWQVNRQNRNVEEIVRRAADLYDKVVGFQDDFNAVENALQRLSKVYSDARRKLYDGPGNILRRTETLRQLGVTPHKSLNIDPPSTDA
ncbi:MAG: DNA recombination protein RmuC [Paludibacteraceae bacterium]|nr:DNA recombination protein RmuC [Paludibacteraceae bacterium]